MRAGDYQACMVAAARLIGRLDAGPVRLRRDGRQARAVGLYFSVKAGRHHPYESKLELHDLWRAEVDSRVVRSFVQPFTLQVMRGGEVTRYTPDRVDVLDDGTRHVVEIKDELTADQVRRRYELIAELLAARGCSFEVRQRAEIEREPRFSGVEAVQRHRRSRLEVADSLRLRRIVGSGGKRFGEVAEQVSAGPFGAALVCAAAVRRLVRIDLSHGLGADAPVELVA